MREAKRERENEKGKSKRLSRRTHPEKIDEEDSGNLILINGECKGEWEEWTTLE